MTSFSISSLPDPDGLVAPVSGIWAILNAILSYIEIPASSHDALLQMKPRSIIGFSRMERLDYLAFWEWCIAATHPDEATIHTPLGGYQLPLAKRDDTYVNRQVNRRVMCALGARCTFDGARASIQDSCRLAIERLTAPMPAGTVAVTDPIDIIADIIATQHIEPNNITLATGATITFIDNCITGTHGTTTMGIRRVWEIASRLGCTITLRCGKRTYMLEPSVLPATQAIAAVVDGSHAKTTIPPIESDETRAMVAAIIDGTESVATIAAKRGVTPQAINARLQACGFGLRELKRHVSVGEANRLLRPLLIKG